ncbi:hypothetical protein ZIOFF_012545 [Zingiber officinale]|uniref:Pentatricopeptide repeat-containing protein n=2 Tax=Zingiber officinale TaxID=94328 RepID=A0A8J5HSI5_ZINOF|nr:hypothetical protein ZIOFF_012545 [Zingiber officinale]
MLHLPQHTAQSHSLPLRRCRRHSLAAAALRISPPSRHGKSLQNAYIRTTTLRPLTSSPRSQLGESEERLWGLRRLIDACSDLRSLRLLHNDILHLKLESHAPIPAALLAAYFRCGAPEAARQLFDRMPHKDVVSWTLRITDCCNRGQFEMALGHFRAMMEQGISPDEVALLTISSAVARYGQPQHGYEVHAHLVRKFGRLRKATVTSLVNMYSKIGRMDYASRIANAAVKNNVAAMTALMTGLLKVDDAHGALIVYQEMMDSGIEPKEKTITCAIRAASKLGLLKLGTQIHGRALKKKIEMDDHLLSCLIDMYSLCGAPTHLCRQLFDQMSVKNVVLYTAMISAYGRQGEGHSSLQLFNDMRAAGVLLDSVAFTAILSACSSSGFLREGLKCFNSMVAEYGIRPREEHYACIRGLLAKSGKLEQAYVVIEHMNLKDDRGIWEVYLDVARIHGDVGCAEIASRKLLEIETG